MMRSFLNLLALPPVLPRLILLSFLGFSTSLFAQTPVPGSNSPLCINSTLALTVNTVQQATYFWTGPNGFSSTQQNPGLFVNNLSMAGTYTLVTTVNSVPTTTTTVVVVNSPPQNVQAFANTPLCVGQTLNLSTSLYPGATYFWQGPSSFTSNLQNPSIQQMTTQRAGSYYLSVTYPGCSASNAFLSVVVNTAPTAVATSNSTVCSGVNLSLAANTVSGATYAWQGPNGWTANIQNPVIQNAQSIHTGTYTLTVTTPGCTPAIATTPVVVNNTNTNATAGSNSPVCVGQTLNLTATTLANTTYSWSGPNGFSSSQQNPSLSPVNTNMAGTYMVYIQTGGCSTVSRSVVVSVSSMPTGRATSNSPVCSGGQIQLSSPVQTGFSYQWQGPNGFFSTLNNPVISSANSIHAGSYFVVIQGGGCSARVDTVVVIVNSAPQISVTSNSPLCTGGTLRFTTTSVSGATYSWQGPNGFTSTQQNPVIQQVGNNQAGNYYVMVSIPGCSPITAFTTVVINSTPTATAGSNSPVCTGGFINLTTPTVSGATYSWTGPNNWTSNIQNPSIQNVQSINAGTYSLVVTTPGCGSATATTSVTINTSTINANAGSNSPVCIGNTLNLTATTISGATYVWTGPNGFGSTQQNPTRTPVTTAMAGTYMVSIQTPGCGTVTRTVVVGVNSIPTSRAGSNSPVCSGGTLQLTAPSQTGLTYSWYGPNGFSSSQSSPVIQNVSTLNAGNYYLVIQGNGCPSRVDTVSVTINTQPQVILTSNSPVCVGGTLSISATSVNGATYSWQGPGGFTSTQQNVVLQQVTTNSAGNYYVIVSVPGCSSYTAFTSVAINSAPSVLPGSNSPICAGGTLALTTNTINGATYTWRGPNGWSSSLQNPVIQNTQSINTGVYSLTVTTTGCGSATGTTSVTINSTNVNATAGANSPICIGQTLNLTATSIPGATYVWTGPNGFGSTQQNPTRTPVTTAMAGTYIVSIQTPGCGTITRGVTVVVNGLPTNRAGSNSPVCTMGTIQFTAPTQNGLTYSWYGPNNFNSTIANPVISSASSIHAGTYYLFIQGSGCPTRVDTVVVAVNSLLQNIAAGANSPLCVSQTLNLTCTSVTGATYSWTGPGGFTSTQRNPSRTNVTTQHSGQYIVVVTVPGCGAITQVVNVQVNNLASAQAWSNSPICAGANLYLTTPAITGATYLWIGPNGYSSTLQNSYLPNSTTANAGVYTVSVTVPGCGTASSTVVVSILNTNTNLQAGANSPICYGQTLNLTSSSITGATYLWTGPNGWSSTQQNVTRNQVTNSMAGAYVLTVTTQGCGTITRSIPVVVNAPAIAQTFASSPLCVGGTLYFSTSTSNNWTYQWTGPNGFSSTSSNPVIQNVGTQQAGVYTLFVTSPGCGTASTTATVVVNPGALNSVVTSNSPVCIGGTLQFSITGVQGATYSWNGPNGFTSTQQNPVIQQVTTANAGGYYVVITTPGCGSVTRTLSVQVNSSVTVSAGSNSPICSGSNLYLSATSVQGATYLWTGPNGFSAQGSNPVIVQAQSNQSGVYSLTVITPCGTQQRTTTVVINNGGNITASANSPACVGGSINLSGTAITGATYSWTGPAGFTANTNNSTLTQITSAMGGNYNYVVSIPGCPSVTRQVNVIVNNPAAVNISANQTLCISQNLAMYAQGPGGSTYTWTGPAGFSATGFNATQYSVTPNNAGIYTLVAQVPGCGPVIRTFPLTVLNCRLGNPEANEPELNVYPNPAETQVELSVVDNKLQFVKVIDMSGRVLIEQTLTGEKSHVELTSVPSGYYLLEIQTDLGTVRKRILKP